MHSVSREEPPLGNRANSDLESDAPTNGRYFGQFKS
jgi:hypothetical protein